MKLGGYWAIPLSHSELSPASSLGAQSQVFPPHGGTFLLTGHVLNILPPKGCVVRK